MDIRTVSIEEVTHDPANARKHGGRNLATIRASLKRYGQQKPLVVDRHMVCMAGNGQLAAARELGWTEVQVAVSDLSATELRAYAIADNRSSDLASWDKGVLASMLEAIQQDEPDALIATGFDATDVSELLREVGAELPVEAAYDPVPVARKSPPPSSAPSGGQKPVPPAGRDAASGGDSGPGAKGGYCCPACGHEWSGNPRLGDVSPA